MTDALKKTGLFILLAFSLSWLIAGVFYWSGGKLQSGAGMVMALVYMAMPMVAALLVQKVFWRQPLREPLRISFKFNRWWLVGWLLPPVIAFATLGVNLLWPGVSYSPDMEGLYERFAAMLTPEQIAQMRAQAAAMPVHPIWLGLAQGLFAGATVNAVAAFGEELGWRGLMLRELGFLGFWRASLLIGLIWGLWHAPIILLGHNYPQHPQAGVFFMTDFALLLSPLIGYVTLKARSVIAASVMHGTVNGTFGLALMLLRGGNDLNTGVTGTSGLIVLLAANLLLFAYDRFLAKRPIRELLAAETR